MISTKALPEFNRLVELFSYENGNLIWNFRQERTKTEKRFNKIHAGKVAGHKSKSGYVVVSVAVENKEQRYMAHRIIYAICKGRIDNSILVDHINRICSDNRIENLRPATNSENKFNMSYRSDSALKIKGVHFNLANGKYAARVMKDGVSFGEDFSSLSDAENWCKETRKILHGSFAKD